MLCMKAFIRAKCKSLFALLIQTLISSNEKKLPSIFLPCFSIAATQLAQVIPWTLKKHFSRSKMFTVESSWFSSSLGSELEKFFSKVVGGDKFDCAKVIQVTQYFCLFICLNGNSQEKGKLVSRHWGFWLMSRAGIDSNAPFQRILGTEQTFLPPWPVQSLTPYNSCNSIPPKRGTKQFRIWSDWTALLGVFGIHSWLKPS